MQERMSLPDTDPLSSRLRRLVQRLRDDSPDLSSRMLGTLRSTIPEYGSLSDALARDVYHVGVKNAQLWYDALLISGKPCDDDLQWIGRFSQRRHAQELSLASLLQAYRIGTRIYMDALLTRVREHPALNDEVLFRVSPFLLYYSDLLSRTVSDAYLAEHTHEMPWQERMHAELCAAVFDPVRPTAFDDATAALGIAADRPHVALALRLAAPVTPALRAALADQAAEMLRPGAASSSCGAAAPIAMALYRDHWLAWLPVIAGEAADARERRLGEQAQRLLKQCGHAAAAGLGLPAAGAQGWRDSAEQAMAAIELGRRLHAGGTSYRYSEFALDTLMHQSPEMSMLCGEMLDGIAAEPALLETLETYFQQRQNHKAAAAALGIHRNTLLHRMARIETLLGASFDDMGWLARLYLALRQRQLGRGAARSMH
jgi:carbohydrate diacid regulator